MASAVGGKKTGRPRSLHEHDIIAAALAEGLTEATMPSIARRLGVSHSALYRYYADRDALLLECVGTAVDSMQWPSDDEPWRDILRSVGNVMWEMLGRYTGLAETMLTLSGTPPQIVSRASALTEALTKQGFSTRDAMLAIDFIGDLTLTTFVNMARLDAPLDDGGTTRDRVRQEWEQPGVLAEALQDDSTWFGRGWLDDKVEILLDGLAHRVQAAS
ncbi:helix-turn-helix transcriptional regulator [Hoyosella rhizosphaerae]|nr:TetR/AcrR family transcriptional regulator [Hoyosella rhizosphaerae]MBN4926561.1 helix-turn-helix transcriptional regulator [Hoyosella rhizosphaerae]